MSSKIFRCAGFICCRRGVEVVARRACLKRVGYENGNLFRLVVGRFVMSGLVRERGLGVQRRIVIGLGPSVECWEVPPTMDGPPAQGPVPEKYRTVTTSDLQFEASPDRDDVEVTLDVPTRAESRN